MLYHAAKPAPPLSDFVHLLWASDGISGQPRKELLMPDGSTELVIGLSDERLYTFDRRNPDYYTTHRGAILAGPHSTPFVIDRGKKESVIGVHFRPGGAFPFFGLPVDELHNVEVSLEDLWGATAADLREQLLSAPTILDKFRVLEAALLHRVPGFARHPAVDFALGRLSRIPQAKPLADLADQVGLSSRRFIQLFRDQVGLTPKLFSRLQRFQRALEIVGTKAEVDWLDITYCCGYFDQAHLIHEFQDFATVKPSAYLAQRTEFHNHVRLVH